MAGLPPIAHHADSPALRQYAHDLTAYSRDFARMTPAQQLVTTRFLAATNHDLIHATGGDARLVATRRYIDAAERLEEAKDGKDAGRLLKKADVEWAVAAGVHDRLPPAVKAATPRLPASTDQPGSALQRRLAGVAGAMPHEGPTPRGASASQTA